MCSYEHCILNSSEIIGIKNKLMNLSNTKNDQNYIITTQDFSIERKLTH